jgi:membrane protein
VASGRARLDAGRARLEGTWPEELLDRLKRTEAFEWTIGFGSALLLSLIPFIILVGSLANQRIDDDISRHIGLDRQGAHIVRRLFRGKPAHAVLPILIGLIIGLAGALAVGASLQTVYERVFDQQPRGWRGIPRFIVWLAVLLVVLVVQGIITHPVRAAVGGVLGALLRAGGAALFFGWTMYFLLAGRVAASKLWRAALLTGVLWVALGIFSSLYFAPLVTSDSKLYGAIGAVFSILTWFMLIGVIIVVGATVGAVWHQRRGEALPETQPETDPPPAE